MIDNEAPQIVAGIKSRLIRMQDNLFESDASTEAVVALEQVMDAWDEFVQIADLEP